MVRAMCPRCGQEPASDCGYLIKDEYGECDCTADDCLERTEYDDCPHIWCVKCKQEARNAESAE